MVAAVVVVAKKEGRAVRWWLPPEDHNRRAGLPWKSSPALTAEDAASCRV